MISEWDDETDYLKISEVDENFPDDGLSNVTDCHVRKKEALMYVNTGINGIYKFGLIRTKFDLPHEYFNLI